MSSRHDDRACGAPLVATQLGTNVQRFFFHFSDGVLVEDRNGQELPDIEAAREEARRIAREPARGGEAETASVVVTDGKQALFEIDLRVFC